MASMNLPMSFGNSSKAKQGTKKAKVMMSIQLQKTAADLDKGSGGAAHAPAARQPAGPWESAGDGSSSGGSGSDDSDEDEGEDGPAGGGQRRDGPAADADGEDDGDGEDDEGEDAYEDDADEDPLGLPMREHIVLKGHGKRCSALALDPAGSRCCTGSYDYQAKLWDFNGMNSSLQSFRQFEPVDGHQVRQICYSPTGSRLLVACHKPEAAIHDRDGKLLDTFAKGDPYLADMIHTKGHIGPINAAHWHSSDVHKIITCAADGTVRLWDSEVMETQTEVIKVRNARGVSGTGVRVSTCAFSDDGKMICAGTEDGTLQVWTMSGKKSRPHKTMRKAHTVGNEITGVSIGPDGHTLASRSFDGTMKVWDLRKFTAPLATFSGLDNFISETDCVFSPSGRYIMTGTSVFTSSRDQEEGGRGGATPGYGSVGGELFKLVGNQQSHGGSGQGSGRDGNGRLVFVDPSTLSIVREVEFPGTSVLRIAWHPKLNQIFVSDGEGNAHCHYTPGLSQKGALLCATKAVSKKKFSGAYTAEVQPEIINPHALPMYKNEQQKAQAAKSRRRGEVEVPAYRRTEPMRGTGALGGEKTASSFTEYIMKQAAQDSSTSGNLRREDPREAILKHAAAAEANPTWISKAYLETQPQTKYAEKTAEQEEEDSKKAFLKK
jgi:WD40 repeat protein